MSDLKNETIADIVADIRAQNQGLPEDGYALSPLAGDLLSIADRIEAAAKRERESGAEAAQVCGEIGEMIGREAARRSDEPTAEKYSAVGNAAAMLEALEKIANMGEEIDYQLGSSDETVYAFRHERSLAYSISECARTALSAPPRNCDVGTAEEQAERFYAFCGYHRFQSGIKGMCSSLCPCIRCRDMCNCITTWEQMPYDEVEK